jgi:hypothetical protein
VYTDEERRALQVCGLYELDIETIEYVNGFFHHCTVGNSTVLTRGMRVKYVAVISLFRGRLRDTILDWEHELPMRELDLANEHCRYVVAPTYSEFIF